MKILFIVPNLEISGGVSVAMSHATVAERAGHEVVVADASDGHATGRAALDLTPISITEVADQQFDVAIATWWQDLRLLAQVGSRHHVLFLQRLETEIYARDDPNRSLAHDAMSVPLPGITIADSLQQAFQSEFGRELAVVKNGIDKSIFRQDGPIFEEKPAQGLRVLVEGPLGVSYKNVIPSLHLAREYDGEVWLLTSTPVGRLWGVDRTFSQLDPRAAAAVYRSCDVLLKLSTVEGLGLPPLEMFHCGGTAVTFDITGVRDYARHDRNALLAPPEDFDLVSAYLGALHSDRSLVARLKQGAVDTANAWPSEAEAGRRFLGEIENIVASLPPTSDRELEALAALPHPPESAAPSARRRLQGSRLMRTVYHSAELARLQRTRSR